MNGSPTMETTEAASKRELILSRVLNAPRELVWQAWTQPEHMAQWWGPQGFTSTVQEMEVRPGGILRLVMHGPDGADYPMGGVFREIVEPERLVMTTTAFEDENGNPHLELLQTITFAEQDGKTNLTVHAVVVKAAPGVEGALAGMEPGWTQSLECLDEYLSQMADGHL